MKNACLRFCTGIFFLIFLWYLLSAILSGPGGYVTHQGYSLTKSDRYPHELSSKVLDIPYFVNDYSFKQLKLNPNAFSKQEEEIENKAFFQAQVNCDN